MNNILHVLLGGLLSIFVLTNGYTQVTKEWAAQIGGTGNDRIYGSCIDHRDNTYSVGHIEGTAFFNTAKVSSNGRVDAMITKHDNDGNLLWVKSFGGENNDHAYSVTCDKIGNAYLTGYYKGSMTVSVNDSRQTFNSKGSGDVFVAKYNSSGNLEWFKSFGGSNNDIGFDVKFNHNSIIVTGQSSGDFIDAENGDTLSHNNTGYAAFMLSLDNDGNVVWFNQLSSTGTARGWGITFDESNNIITTGYFTGNLYHNTSSFTSNGGKDIFVSKTDNEGNVLWINTYGGTGDDQGKKIVTDNVGNIYLSGHFQNTISHGQVTVSATGGKDIFLAKIDDAGSMVWGKTIGGAENDFSHGININSNGDLYLIGNINGTVDVDPSDGILELISENGDDMCLSKFNTNGDIIWATTIQGSGFNVTRGIVIQEDNNIIISGFFTGSHDNDPLSTLTDNFNAYGSKDAFILKLNETSLTHVISEENGLSLTTFDETINIKPITGAIGYDVLFVNTLTGDSIEHNTSSDLFNLSEMSLFELNQSYSTRVRAIFENSSSPYGEQHTIYTPSTPPSTSLMVTYCNATLESITDAFFAEAIAGAENYEFEFTNQLSGNVTTVQTGSSSSLMRLSVAGLNALLTSYDVRVRAMIDNTWGAFGDACEVNSPAEMSPTGSTKLRNSSCGTTLSSFDERIRAKNVSGGLAYVFEILNTETNQIVEILRFRRWFTLSEIGYTDYDVVYEIRVKAWSWETGDVGDFGDVCTIQAPLSSPKYGASSLEENIASSTPVVYPNPSSGEYVYIALSSELTQEVDILIIDAMGSISNTSTTTLNEGENAVYIDFKNTLQPGIYYIRILDKTVRFIVQ